VSFLGCASKSPTRTVTSDISAALENDINCVSVAIFGCSFKSTTDINISDISVTLEKIPKNDSMSVYQGTHQCEK
jgi:hypothetical protein